MTPRAALGVALGGAVGTALRLAAAAPLPLALAGLGPWRLLAVNVGGAFALGARGALAARRPRLRGALPVLATGLLGGLTTFSSMVVAAGRLGHDLGLVAPGTARMTGAGLGLAAAYLVGSLAAGVAALRAGRLVAGRRAAG
ncbi:MAG: CrcB family protein [Nitriliruptoraceae bacterium]